PASGLMPSLPTLGTLSIPPVPSCLLSGAAALSAIRRARAYRGTFDNCLYCNEQKQQHHKSKSEPQTYLRDSGHNNYLEKKALWRSCLRFRYLSDRRYKRESDRYKK